MKVKTPRRQRCAGILDIYGFQSGLNDRNGFEQLVINFANEKMQQVQELASFLSLFLLLHPIDLHLSICFLGHH